METKSMGKGDERRPTAISDEEFEERWERAFKKVPAPPRERSEPHNAGSESFGERYRSDHLPGGAFSREPAEGLTPPYYKIADEEKRDE